MSSSTHKVKFSNKMKAFSYYAVLKYDYFMDIKRPYFENNKWVLDWGTPKDKIIGFPEEFRNIRPELLELAEKEAEKIKRS